MKHLVTVFILIISVSACSPGQVFGPTLTPTSTITFTPTPTLTSTATFNTNPYVYLNADIHIDTYTNQHSNFRHNI